jgi:hypothetical protein
MRNHTAFLEGKNWAILLINQDYTLDEIPNDLPLLNKAPWLLTYIRFRPVFYATLGST